MFAKILHRPALAIVISLIILFMGGLGDLHTAHLAVSFRRTSQRACFRLIPRCKREDSDRLDNVLLEQAINGVPNMRYMQGAATSAGEGTIQITFEPGTDPDIAVMNVNNRVQMVKNNLPPIVEREGIIVMQNMASMLMYLNIYSTDPKVDQNFLYNYATVNVLNEIKTNSRHRTGNHPREPLLRDARGTQY